MGLSLKYCKAGLGSVAKFAVLMIAGLGVCQASEALNICGAPLPPYSYLDNGVPTGIDVEVAKTIFDQLHVPVTINIEPFARCQLELRSGDADIGFAVSDVLDRRNYVYFPKNPVWQISYVFFTNPQTKQRYAIHGLEDAKRSNLRIGVVRGAAYNADFWTVFPGQDKAVNEGYNSALTPAADTATNLRRLDLDYIQLYPQDRVAGIWAAYYDDVLFTKDYPNAFSKASRFSNAIYPNIVALMEAYDEKLAAFKKTDKYKALFTSVLSVDPAAKP